MSGSVMLPLTKWRSIAGSQYEAWSIIVASPGGSLMTRGASMYSMTVITAVPTNPPRMADPGLGRMKGPGRRPGPLLRVHGGIPQLERGRELLPLPLFVHRPDDGAGLHLEVLDEVVRYRHLGPVREYDPPALHSQDLAFHHLAGCRHLWLLLRLRTRLGKAHEGLAGAHGQDHRRDRKGPTHTLSLLGSAL